MPRTARLSPGRRQYLKFKQQHSDALLLFRMGDFFETFDDDARILSQVLDIALTSRDVGGGVRSHLAGFPHHALDTHLGKLVEAGLKVAICEQVSDPAASKGIVDRAVVRLVTPGTVLDPPLLDSGKNNYLAAAVSDGQRAGLAWIDVSTSEFVTQEIGAGELPDEVERLSPSELLADEAARALVESAGVTGPVIRDIDASRLDFELSAEALKSHFGVATLEAYGCDNRPLAVMAAAEALAYLRETQLGALPQITHLRTDSPAEFMKLDQRALRDLEVFEPHTAGSESPALLATVDRTRTAMGARLLRAWLSRPLLELQRLSRRQDAVEMFVGDPIVRADVREALGQIPDLERLTNKVRAGRPAPRDLAAIAKGLSKVPAILDSLGGRSNGVSPVASGLNPCTEVVELIGASISDDPSHTPGDGGVIRPGFDAELDETRGLAGEARSHIAGIEAEARSRTGIKSLKVGYNKVFGYYIEVSRPNLDRVPPEFERRQTLVNGERFITPALKSLEVRILNARERIDEIERSIFGRVCSDVSAHGQRITSTAAALARIDALSGLAEAASENGWVRPQVDDGDRIVISGGRHPAVEAALGPGRFVPNDVDVSCSGDQVLIITGPNMSGKSTFIRQVAVLTLLAQTGSFIPANSASIGLVDRIFTRAGLSDDIGGGRSTFMVEMVDAATILNQATPRSLAVLDELGRGTSTYDGLAIARAIAEHIHNHSELGCRTLFATHYHEMTALSGALPRAANYRVAVSEEGGKIVFLHRIEPGGADRSYGVHVGQLAGLPKPVVQRARQILEELEAGSKRTGKPRRQKAKATQMDLFAPGSEVVRELSGLDVSEMTPMEAINALYRLQQMAKEG